MNVPAINFKKYLGATGVRYIQLGQARHVQENQVLNLEETVRQAESFCERILRTGRYSNKNRNGLIKH